MDRLTTRTDSQPPKSAPSHGADDNAYLGGNFAPMTSETTAFNLETRGRVPDELEGRLVRIGPSPIGPVDRALYHWFTGTGLAHGLRLRGGRAEWYRSRFTLSADAAAALGKAAIPGPGDGQTAVNTNVTLVGGRVLAIVEGGAASDRVGLQPGKRRSLGLRRFARQGGFTAHPEA